MIVYGGMDAACGTHRMRLMPIIDFALGYRCRDCGGMASLGFSSDTAGLSLEDAAKVHLETLARLTGMAFEMDEDFQHKRWDQAEVLAWLEQNGLSRTIASPECACEGTCPCHEAG